MSNTVIQSSIDSITHCDRKRVKTIYHFKQINRDLYYHDVYFKYPNDDILFKVIGVEFIPRLGIIVLVINQDDMIIRDFWAPKRISNVKTLLDVLDHYYEIGLNPMVVASMNDITEMRTNLFAINRIEYSNDKIILHS